MSWRAVRCAQTEWRDAAMTQTRKKTKTEMLTDAYLHTTYRVLAADETIDIRIGAVNPVLDSLLQMRQVQTWAFVTASNPRSRKLSIESNAERNDAMKKSLREAGWRYLAALGVPDRQDWRPEHSVLIPGIGRDEAVALGRRWEQNAIVFGKTGESPELVWIE